MVIKIKDFPWFMIPGSLYQCMLAMGDDSGAFMSELKQSFKKSVVIPEGVMLDTHVHTIESDGELTLKEIMSGIPERDCYGVSVTDHNNTRFFDNIVDGKLGFKYELDPDGRALSFDWNGKKRFILRSAEIRTKEGYELGLHGFKSQIPYGNILDGILSTREVIDIAQENDAFVVINHPYLSDYGICRYEEECMGRLLEYTREKNVCCFLEKNYFSAAVFIHCPARIRSLRKRIEEIGYPIQVINGSDTHINKFGYAGIVFEKDEFEKRYEMSRSYADTVKKMIVEGKYKNYGRYLQLREFLTIIN